ncbi:hypothetical protein JKP88DRAFT_350801 [Tribonema minus]|uniref:Cdc23 domain-containing protein n=1 Tax=Tribonema minus TaxID=303371 RepID=A0A835YMH9_9STRA|nr:hypothetical protein JKP88DRAFT_350801 [Tribonema minus]
MNESLSGDTSGLLADATAQRAVAKYELRLAVRDLSARGLKLASKWAAEQLLGLPPGPASAHSSLYPRVEFTEGDGMDSMWHDQLLFARTLLDTGEYQRAAAVFGSDAQAVAELPAHAQFVRHYALYLAGEKRKAEEKAKLSGPLERCSVTNPNLLTLHEELSTLHERGQLDGFGLYMFGVVLREMKVVSPTQDPLCALSVLLESVRTYSWNWSAWLDLAEVALQFDTIPEEVEGPLEHCCCPYMHRFFLLHLYQSQPQGGEAMELVEGLRETFTSSLHLTAQEGVVHFNDRNFKEARKVFKGLFESDPLRLDDLYLYAHVLFVDSAKAELSHLAHIAVKTDQFRPETCCILGNYCSIKGEHHRAIMYFSRALRLNHKFHEAWTLLGHEYLELKKTGAAIEHYRRGIDANARDFRAWNGLGHTYELMQMNLFALYYFRRAAALRPYDSRMLNSLASTFEKLGRSSDAIRVYLRSVAVQDSEGIALMQLAKLYAAADEIGKAADCYQELLETRGLDQLEPDVRVEALLYLAQACRDSGDYEHAEQYAAMLMDYSGPEKEQAQAILRQVRALERQNDSAMSMDMADASMESVNAGGADTSGSFMLSP